MTGGLDRLKLVAGPGDLSNFAVTSIMIATQPDDQGTWEIEI
jgi:hypothetical protein